MEAVGGRGVGRERRNWEGSSWVDRVVRRFMMGEK